MKIIISSLFIFVTTLHCTAQSNNSLLWKIEGNGLEEPSYLYGTIHLSCEGDIELSESVGQAFNRTELLVLELDMDDPTMMVKMQKLTFNDDLKNISSEFEDDELQLVNDFFKEHYYTDLSTLGMMKPFFLQTMITMKSLECSIPVSVEDMFLTMANENDIEVEGLEEIEEQIAIFDEFDLETQIDWIVETVENFEEVDQAFQDLLAAYKNQDLEALSSLILDDPLYEDHEEFYDKLLEERNKNWIPLIEEYIKEQPTFFAVGAGHLGTDVGVITLLQEKGYTVSPVME